MANFAFTGFFALCALCCISLRIWTAYQNYRAQNDSRFLEKSPPIMPYWLPYLGHAPSFALSFESLLIKARDTTKDGIVGLSMFGTKQYIITMPSLTKKYYRQSAAVLSGDDFL